MKTLLALAGFAAAFLPIAEASAQVIGTYRVRPGLGAQIRPDYPGADKSEWAPYVSFSIARGDKPFGFGAPDDSFGIGLIGGKGFSAGPAAKIQGGRKDSEIGAPLGKVSTTIEAGAFAQFEPTESVRLRGELRKGIGGHEGLVGSIAADHIWRDGDNYLFSIGPRLLFSDGRYQRAFFGVGPEAAIASGLEQHRPDGGIYAAAATSSLRYSLGGNWGLFGYARYERLLGDARKSPIVRELGSPNQYSAGIGLSRTFTIKL
jgi:outer membrane protein